MKNQSLKLEEKLHIVHKLLLFFLCQFVKIFVSLNLMKKKNIIELLTFVVFCLILKLCNKAIRLL